MLDCLTRIIHRRWRWGEKVIDQQVRRWVRSARQLTLPLLLIATSACATAISSGGNANISILSQADADRCRLIGDAHGTSPFYGFFAGPAMEDAREAVLKKAVDMGGSGVVWKGNDLTSGSTTVNATVYDCRSVRK